MKLKNFTILAVLLLAGAALFAGAGFGDKASKWRALKERKALTKPGDFSDRKLGLMDNGRMRMFYDNNGFIGDRNYTRSIEWPAGSLNYMVWQVGIIFGGVTAAGDTICSESYNDISDNQFNPEPGYDNPNFIFDLLNNPIVARSDLVDSYAPRWQGLWPAFGGGTVTADSLRRLARQESYWVMRDNNDPVVSPNSHLNIEVEARFIQINDVLTQDFVFAFYKVRNNLPNGENLRRCRFGVLADTDIPALVGADFEDDDSNFIRDLNLAYARDSDNFYASRPELNPGHFGVKFLRSPEINGNELGLTGWVTFEYNTMPDIGSSYLTEDGPDPGLGQFNSRDHAQYGYMQPGLFMKPRFNKDVGFILSSGEFDLAKGDSVEIGVAYIAAPNLETLLSNANAVQTVFDNNFRIPTPPEPPHLVAVPDNEKVTLYWEAEPSENSLDQLTGRQDFEGYRIYRSEDRGQTWGLTTDNALLYPNGFVPLAEYDVVNIPGQLAGIVVTHSNPISDATILSEGIADGTQPGDAEGVNVSGVFSNDNFQILFESDSVFQVLNASLGRTLPYLDDLSGAVGFAVLDTNWVLLTDNPDATRGKYRSGFYIYLTGMFVRIDDGQNGPPRAGDIFTVDQRRNEPGKNAGLRHSYVDQNRRDQPKRLFNGYEYWYTVAAYDRPDLVVGVPSKENLPLNIPGIPDDQTVAVIPQASGAGLVEASVDTSFDHVAGNSDVEGFEIQPIDLTKVTGHRYEISFNDAGADKTYSVKDLGAPGQPFKLVDQPFYEAAADNAKIFDGIRLIIVDVEPGVNEDASGQTAFAGGDTLTLEEWDLPDIGNTLLQDYEIRFDGNVYTYTDYNEGTPVTAPFAIFDVTAQPEKQITVEFFDSDGDADGAWDIGEQFSVVNTDYTGSGGFEGIYPDDYAWRILLSVNDPSGLVNAGNVFKVVTNKSLTSADRYQFRTTARSYVETAQEMDKIRVVPNPFVVTSGFDTRADRHEIQFTRLPEKCSIKIFTLAGELVKQIEYNRNGEGLNFARWDLKTEFGSEVAYGVYLYHIDSPIGTKMGKIAVLR
ncbi:MAG: hypothetical protein ACREOI_02385 [bacterium]